MQRRRRALGLAGLLVALLPAVAAAPTPAAAAAPTTPPFTPLATTPLPAWFSDIAVDDAHQRVFISSEVSNVVTVVDFDGQIRDRLSVPGAGDLLLDGGTLYVASTTGGRIDAFDTTTLSPAGSHGGGALVRPRSIVKAGGRLWFTTGECGGLVQWASLTPGTGTVTTYPSPGSLRRCPILDTSPSEPDVIYGVDADDGQIERLDVSTGAPVSAGSLWTDNRAKDLEVLPGGQALALASTSPAILTFGTNPVAPLATSYLTGTYHVAVDSTAGAGGLLAAARRGTYEPDIYVFRLGDPTQSFLEYDFGASNNTVWAHGLAFSASGSRLFAVSGDDSGERTAALTVFGPPAEGGRYHPLPPARILDTRTGGAGGAVGNRATVDVQVTGQGGVPSTGVSAVAVNVTVTQPTATSFLTLYPAGTSRPLASNLNFTAGKTVPNLVVVKVGTGGKVSIYNLAGTAEVVIDVAGWFPDPSSAGEGGRYTPLPPARILDTRESGGRLSPGGSLDLQVAGRGGVPLTGAMAAVLNITATGTTATSFLTAFPAGASRPLASTVNFDGGDTVSNRAMVKLGTGGAVTVYNLAGDADLVVDVVGWYSDATVAPAGGTVAAIPPARILDTRDFWTFQFAPIQGGTAMTVQVAGRAGVPPTGATAVILNATVTQPTGPGFVTIFPTGGNLPPTSDVTYAGGETRPNLAVVPLGIGGSIDVYSSTTAHVVLDVTGWVSA